LVCVSCDYTYGVVQCTLWFISLRGCGRSDSEWLQGKEDGVAAAERSLNEDEDEFVREAA